MDRRWLRASGVVVAGLGLLVSARSVAHAESATKTVRLVLVRGERTESCSDGGAIARRVTARLGRDVFAESAPESIEGVIQHDGERWVARLYVRDASGALVGSRALSSESADCSALDAAVTLAIALAIDPDAALRGPPRLPPAAPPSPPIPPTASVAPSADVFAQSPRPVCPALPAASPARPCPEAPQGSASPAPARRGGGPTSASVALRAVLAPPGLLPSTSAGMAISSDMSMGGVVGATAGMFYLPEVRSADQGFAFGLTAAWLGVCAEPWRGRYGAFAVCGKAMIGAIHSVVYTLPPVGPGDRPWGAASLSVVLRLRLVGPLFGEFGGEAVAPFWRHKFEIQDQLEPTFQETMLAGLGFVGLGLSIP